ncbi:PadR family transcriptional regulator [Curvivirga aplysinae]|uniref:PadR family transcriptional regulator n=1 Tax=Curvivirga aplysinae TaxID=2529852 RepID=UPI0012BCB29B|nr:PadR family transcriptional regulator [Curvivirga aplysinae]MTI10724.1 PadR family transcriptional regulator [Curvivirga aplysinae]
MDIRTSCLGVLALNNASGYEIRKMFEDGPFSVFAEGGFGSIYPALKKLEQDGLVTSETLDQDNRPQKNVYKITTKGRLELIEALSNNPVPDKFKSDFLFSMFFAEYLSPAFVENTIDQRIKSLKDKINTLETERSPNGSLTKGQAFVHAFGLHMSQAAKEFLEENKHIAIAAALTGSPANKQDAAE